MSSISACDEPLNTETRTKRRVLFWVFSFLKASSWVWTNDVILKSLMRTLLSTTQPWMLIVNLSSQLWCIDSNRSEPNDRAIRDVTDSRTKMILVRERWSRWDHCTHGESQPRIDRLGPYVRCVRIRECVQQRKLIIYIILFLNEELIFQ